MDCSRRSFMGLLGAGAIGCVLPLEIPVCAAAPVVATAKSASTMAFIPEIYSNKLLLEHYKRMVIRADELTGIPAFAMGDTVEIKTLPKVARQLNYTQKS